MHLKSAKLKAQIALFSSRKKAMSVSVFHFFCKVFLFLSMLFCIYILSSLPQLLNVNTTLYLKIGLYALFSLGAVCSLLLYSLLPFLKARWFFWNLQQKAKFSAFFLPISLHTMSKISTLFLFSRALMLFKAVFYFLPFILFTIPFVIKAVRGAFAPFIFYTYLFFLVFLFLISCYYVFVESQKYSLIFQLCFLEPALSCVEILKKSQKETACCCFTLAHRKIEFLPWFLFAFLLFPAPYVDSYFAETCAAFQFLILRKEYHLNKKIPTVQFIFSKSASNASLAKTKILRYT